MNIFSFILWAIASISAFALFAIFGDGTGLFFVIVIGVAVAIASIPGRKKP